MRYIDTLHGGWEVPPWIADLMTTPLVDRLHGISMDSLPKRLAPYGVADRHEHSMGVIGLALKAVKKNIRFLTPREIEALLATAGLHDVGTGPFSHLVEPFMKQEFGTNGESFLAHVLPGTSTAALIEKHGLTVREVVAMVTGQTALSRLIHCGMDVDNLDNVLRYWFRYRPGEKLFNAARIANSYRWRNGRWELEMDSLPEAQRWQMARRMVYRTIYGVPHNSAASMLYRAVDLAYRQTGELGRDFYSLDDERGLGFLLDRRGSDVLAQSIVDQAWYEQVVSITTTEPDERMLYFTSSLIWNGRGELADYLCKELRFPAWALTAYVGRGKDSRKIGTPFTVPVGEPYFAGDDAPDTYRLQVYLHPEFRKKRERIMELLDAFPTE